MLEVQIVDARGGDFVAAVAASHQTGKLIDPRDQLAAEQTAIAVDMAVHQKIRLLCLRMFYAFLCHFFHFTNTLLFTSCFLYLYTFASA